MYPCGSSGLAYVTLSQGISGMFLRKRSGRSG